MADDPAPRYAPSDFDAVCLCGRTARHLPTTDCVVVVFQKDPRSTASETRGEVEHDA